MDYLSTGNQPIPSYKEGVYAVLSRHINIHMTYEQMKEKIFTEVEKYRPELVLQNDDIALHPELSGKEYETSKKHVALLQKHGYTTEYPFSGLDTAFRGIYGSNNHKYKIALLAEYDALPEIGHACGHCLSGCISILAGLAMRDLQDVLNADIHIIGTPDEENNGSKCIMVRNGVFDQYDMAMMVHLHKNNTAMPQFQGLASSLYEFHGKSAHASAAPWDGINALNGVQLMLHAVDMLRQHTRLDAQFHAVIRNGGLAPNIVPEAASLEIYVRAGDKKYLEKLIQLVDDCAKGAAIATQTTWSKTPTAETYVDLRSNPTGESCLHEVFQELNLPETPQTLKLGSSDIGNVSYVCPAFHPGLRVVDGVALHTREFAEAMTTERAHQALGDGAKLIALQIVKIFSDESKIQAMHRDFQRGL